jgi:acyl-CoA synthetase (AMP-forming)/AMP-acid ligase II
LQVSHNYAVETLAALERAPNAIAMSSADSSVKNGEFAGLARRFALQMRLRGIGPGSRVVIALRHGPTAFLTAFAAGLVGACWVSFSPRLPFQALGTTHLLHGADRPAGVTHPGMHEIDDGWALPSASQARTAGTFAGFASPDAPAFIRGSSGTTGVPKFMVRSCERFASTVNNLDMSGNRAVSTLFPLTTPLGFLFTMKAMVSGIRVVRPTRVVGEAAALQRMGVHCVFGTPNYIDAFCRGLPPPSRIRTLWVGGSVMTPQAVRHWLRFFEQVTLSYGAAEIGGGGRLTLKEVDDRTEIAYPLRPETVAEIVAEDGKVLPHSTSGILRLRSRTMAAGYLGEPEASAEVFRDGWFYPGDMGLLTPDGRLKILGRIKDQFNLGGMKLNAADVDEAARSVAGVREAMCFTVTSPTGLDQLRLCAVKEKDRDAAATAAAIRAACGTQVRRELEQALSAIYFVDALPLNEAGKAVRGEGRGLVAGLPAF